MKLWKRKARVNRGTSFDFETMNHTDLVERGRSLGLPPFCGAWPTKTLREKVKELENGNS